MKPYLLLITISWVGSASLQHIATGYRGDAETDFDPTRFEYIYRNLPLPYRSPSTQAAGSVDNLVENPPDETGDRRSIGNFEKEIDEWLIEQIGDPNKSSYYPNCRDCLSKITIPENPSDAIDEKDKRNFSPWGGKRGKPVYDAKWYWKRTDNAEGPTMPKRVRFSPWGGKRSGQFMYKTTGETVPVITNDLQPEQAEDRVKIAGFRLIDKRRPITVLTLSHEGGLPRKAMPFKSLMEHLPRFFKIGHPYADVNLKTDGKRKVKFSAWGGKRSPPIIGPIWTSAPSNFKESTLNAILLIRNHLHRNATVSA